jgi:aldehyde reductase
LYPVHATGKYLFGDEDYVDTWKAMEEVCKKGLTKSIGVSNFNKRQIERVLEKATILPVTNQVSSGSFVDLWELDSGFVD